jgi:ankyrin repeat protein
MSVLKQIADGRTDLVFEFRESGGAATARDEQGVSLVQHCAYYGDVSAIKFLLAQGASLSDLGENLGLNGASFHGHWRLCAFVLERGADVNAQEADTGETALHAALCTTNRVRHDVVVRVLLARGANPNAATVPGVETGAFMRDCRTKGETPLHRAAAFGNEETIQMLLDAEASKESRDVNGDTPLSWASWYGRPNSILRKLLYGSYRIHPENRGMERNITGDP